jgi:hypothetical protein
VLCRNERRKTTTCRGYLHQVNTPFSRKSVRYMNAGMRVANLISFSCTSLRLDLYSFSSSVSCFFSFSVSSLFLALFLS